MMESHVLNEINRAVLERFIAAWGRKDLDDLMACVTDDFVYRASIGVEPGTTYDGRDAVRAGVQAMWAADAGSQAEIMEINVVGDTGWIRWVYCWPNGISAHQNEIGCDLITFRDGRLTRKDAYRKVQPPRSVPFTEQDTERRCEAAKVGVGYITRYADADDAAGLLLLMKQLAVFEGYANNFRVTEKDLLERGLAHNSAGQFTAVVAQSDLGELWGYAVVYSIPFTFDLAPTLVLKELLVTETARGVGVGNSLMEYVIAHASASQCRLLKWDVLPSNDRAKTFYSKWGGAHNVAWENWILPV
jgi:ketosteroid isomerase-like protein/ribosomal protein S18 acetylase RimI-like enzyme